MDQITTSQSAGPLDRIGYGSCGSVWSDSSRFPDIDQCNISTIVIKRADGLPDRSIENEARMHKHILSNIGHFRINIPRHIGFLHPESSSWSDILPRLPVDARPCQALISERILPVPRHTRRLTVEKFWNGPADMIDHIVNDRRNQHCLIRPYLGRRRVDRNASVQRSNMVKPITLRNYPLHIDQIEALGLPTHMYARAMADGDGDDTDTFTSSALGVHALWILDFDCCKKLPMTSEGVKIAAERFWRNDPFYPNPNTKCEQDAVLWHVFKQRFLEASAKVMADKDERIRALPGQLIDRIVDTVGVYSRGVPSA